MIKDLDKAVSMMSLLTQRVTNITAFVIVIIIVFIMGPFKMSRPTKVLIKLVIVIILGIVIYTNYVGISNIEDTFGEKIKSDKDWKTMSDHINYSYMYSSALGVFLLFIVYTCL